MSENLNLDKNQLEIGFETNTKSHCRPRRQPRRKRAQWWFHQMRVLVNSAVDWTPASPARPQQTCFTLTRGQ